MPGHPSRAELRLRVEQLQLELEEACTSRGDDPRALEEACEGRVAAEEEVGRLLCEITQLREQLSSRATAVLEESLLEAQDAADMLEWQLWQTRQETEMPVACKREAVRTELRKQHVRELAIREEVITLLKEKLSQTSRVRGPTILAANSELSPVQDRQVVDPAA